MVVGFVPRGSLVASVFQLPLKARRARANALTAQAAHFAKQIYLSSNLCRKPSLRPMSWKLICTNASWRLLIRW